MERAEAPWCCAAGLQSRAPAPFPPTLGARLGLPAVGPLQAVLQGACAVLLGAWAVLPQLAVLQGACAVVPQLAVEPMLLEQGHVLRPEAAGGGVGQPVRVVRAGPGGRRRHARGGCVRGRAGPGPRVRAGGGGLNPREARGV